MYVFVNLILAFVGHKAEEWGEGEPFNCGFIWLHRPQRFPLAVPRTFGWTSEHWTFDRTFECIAAKVSCSCSQNSATDPSHQDAAQIRRKLEKFGLFMWISAYLCTQESYKIERQCWRRARGEPSIFGRSAAFLCRQVKPPPVWATKQLCALKSGNVPENYLLSRAMNTAPQHLSWI